MPELLSKEESEKIIMACAADISAAIAKHFSGHPQLGALIGLAGGYGTYVAHNLDDWHEAMGAVHELHQTISEALAEEHQAMIISSIPDVRQQIARLLGVDPDLVEVVSVGGVRLDGSDRPADTERELQRIEDIANESEI